MLEMDAMAVLNFSTAFSSSSNSTNEGLAGIFGGRCIPSDFGMPVTTSYITPQAVLASYRTSSTNSAWYPVLQDVCNHMRTIACSYVLYSRTSVWTSSNCTPGTGSVTSRTNLF